MSKHHRYRGKALTLPWCFLGAAAVVLACNAAAQSQENAPVDPRLQELRGLYPAADANSDGILTAAELEAYKQNMKPPLAPTSADAKYGPAERNVLDFWQATTERPAPLVVYIHGGGFIRGDKRMIPPAMLRAALDSGISMASLNYRFVDGVDTLLPAPQNDGARAIQFLRSKASAWRIDPNRIACCGESAGAGISMWIAFHDDLADVGSDDLVLRQSTRVLVVGTLGGQATYDPIKIKELIGGRAWEHPANFKAFGIQSVDEALHPSPQRQTLYDESGAITHLTNDDPPLCMVYWEADRPLSPNARPGQGMHHPNFGKLLKERMDVLKILNVSIHTNELAGRDPHLAILEFFKKQFAASNPDRNAAVSGGETPPDPGRPPAR